MSAAPECSAGAPAEESAPRSLRVGVLCDAPDSLERWQVQCVQALLALSRVSLCAAVVDPRARPRTRVPLLPAPACFERQAFACQADTLQWRDEGALDALRAARPDLLLCFNFDALDEALIQLPPLGVWCFAQDAAERTAGIPACFFEVEGRHSVQRVSLVRLVAPDAGVHLHDSVLRVVRSSWSTHVTRIYDEYARCPARLCRSWLAGLALEGAGPWSALAPAAPERPLALHRFALRVLGRRLRRALARQLRREEWGVGLVRQPLHEVLRGSPRPEVEWLEPVPPALFRADPFGAQIQGEAHVLFEEWDPRLARGVISGAPVDAAGRAGRAVRIFETPHHLSYPCLLEHEGELYCIPETAQAGEVALYRCQRGDEDPRGPGRPRVLDPRGWQRVATLIADQKLVDATPCFHEGRWWLFCAEASGDAASRLRLFMAERLEGPFAEHPRSPVKVDVRSARPAGTPFVHAGALYRPAQDCGTGYGAAVVILRVDTLNEKEYAERPVARIEPDPSGAYPDGLHTLTAFGDGTLVDGKRWSPIGPLRHLPWLRRLVRP